MPYSSVKDVPDYVPKAKRKQWLEVWNSAYKKALKDGKTPEEAESLAFAEANSVTGSKKVLGDGDEIQKFVPFSRVVEKDDDTVEVYGLVTAQRPDKDDEVCDYAKSKVYYDALVKEQSKRTGGDNLFPLREMHQLSAVGKGIKYDPNDAAKEIHMGFCVVDPNAVKKVRAKVYTGFSHGGRVVGKMIKDPDFPGCMRYVINPSEQSLVDNPCLEDAAYEYVRADGSVEIVKIAKAKNANEKDTKRVAGKDCPKHCFAYRPDDHPKNWYFPIESPDDDKPWEERHIRNALSQWSKAKHLSDADEKKKAWERIVAAAKKHDIEVTGEKLAKVYGLALDGSVIVKRTSSSSTIEEVRRALAKTKSERREDVVQKDVLLEKIKDILVSKLGARAEKGMYDVSRLAELLQTLCWARLNAEREAEVEGDDSEVPSMLQSNLKDLIESFLAMAEEETSELAALNQAGERTVYMVTTVDLIKAANTSLAKHFKTAASHHEKLAKIHKGMAEEHGDMADHHKAAKAEGGEGVDFHKAAHNFHKAMTAHHEKKADAHEAHANHLAKMADGCAAESEKVATSETAKVDGATDPKNKATAGNAAAGAAAAPAAASTKTLAEQMQDEITKATQNELEAWKKTDDFKSVVATRVQEAKEKILSDANGELRKIFGDAVVPSDVRVGGLSLVGRDGELLDPPQSVLRAKAAGAGASVVPADLQSFTETRHEED